MKSIWYTIWSISCYAEEVTRYDRFYYIICIIMAWKVQVKFTLHMPAWKATPAPPIGPILGQHGINIGAFVKEFNDKTMETMQKFAGAQVKVPVDIKVFVDRSYSMEIHPPITPDLIKWKANVKKWAGEPNKETVATISKADLEEIIDIKMPVMNTNNRESIMKSFIGTAKSLGIQVK